MKKVKILNNQKFFNKPYHTIKLITIEFPMSNSWLIRLQGSHNNK